MFNCAEPTQSVVISIIENLFFCIWVFSERMSTSLKNKINQERFLHEINSIAPIQDQNDWDFGSNFCDTNPYAGDLLFEKEIEDFQKESEEKAEKCDWNRIVFAIICCLCYGFVLFCLLMFI